MSKKFYAVNRETGEKWEPDPNKTEYLVMYDSGYLAVVTEDFYTYIEPLDTKIWKKVNKAEDHLKKKKLEAVNIIEKLIKMIDKYYPCPHFIRKDLKREIDLLKED